MLISACRRRTQWQRRSSDFAVINLDRWSAIRRETDRRHVVINDIRGEDSSVYKSTYGEIDRPEESSASFVAGQWKAYFQERQYEI